METGVSHNKQRLHKIGYFPELLANADAVSTSIRPLLQLSRESITRLQRTEGAIIGCSARELTVGQIENPARSQVFNSSSPGKQESRPDVCPGAPVWRHSAV
jgi:hypothetical protein